MEQSASFLSSKNQSGSSRHTDGSGDGEVEGKSLVLGESEMLGALLGGIDGAMFVNLLPLQLQQASLIPLPL